jgi:hypothetical protein
MTGNDVPAATSNGGGGGGGGAGAGAVAAAPAAPAAGFDGLAEFADPEGCAPGAVWLASGVAGFVAFDAV